VIVDRLQNNIKRTEALFERSRTIKRAYILIIRYWAAYRLTDDAAYLNKAYYTAAASLEENPADTRLKFVRVYLDLQKGETSHAVSLLAAFEPHKNYLRQSEPENYCIFMFLSILIDIKNNKDRAVAKKIKKMAEIDALPSVILAFIDIELGDFKSAYGHLVRSLKKGYGTFFAYVGLHTVFMAAADSSARDTHYVFTDFLKWSITQGVIFDDFPERYQASVMMRHSRDINKLIYLYDFYKERFLLDLICQNLITLFDYSEIAYRYYKEAQDKQIIVLNLEIHLMRAAFVNKNEDIARFTMANFLRHHTDDYNLKSFVYHLLVTNSKFEDLAEENRPLILDFAVSALTKGERGMYYNSIYRYYLQTNMADADKSLIGVCEDILYEELFSYEAVLADTNIKTIWVFDKEKIDHTAYDAVHNPPYKAKVRIKSVSRGINYICFDASGYNMAEAKLDFKRCVANADIGLCRLFTERYPNDADLLIVMARHLTETNDTSDYCVTVINKTLAGKSISRGFRMMLTAYLGNILAGRGGYDEAIEYYRVVDENYLSDKYIEQMLTAFINAREYDLAVSLIVKKSYCVSDRTLFLALKQAAAFEKYHKQIADAAYELLLKSWYDKALIDIVIKHYNGSQEDYEALAQALYNIQAPEITIDKRILQNCIEMHKLDKPSQKVFVRLYQAFPDAEITDAFIYYLCYEMLVKNAKIEYDAVSALEWRFEFTKNKLIAYALTNLYLCHNVTTSASNGIIEKALDFMEEDGILFECVSNIKDKDRLRPYIVKNTGFVYKSLPGKDVYLNYCTQASGVRDKTSERYIDGAMYRVKMKYFRFGLYMCAVPAFYNEELVYYFSEEMSSGSINTGEQKITNTRASIIDDTEDMFFTVNNALVYEQMFRYDEVEKIITSSLQTTRLVMGAIL